MKKLKELPRHKNLQGVKVKLPDGRVGYWVSQWGYPNGKAGVWLSASPNCEGKVTPIFLDKLQEALEWEVVDEVQTKNTK
jgi:hypothetical protein